MEFFTATQLGEIKKFVCGSRSDIDSIIRFINDEMGLNLNGCDTETRAIIERFASKILASTMIKND